jgi:hypothetical protein
MREQPAEVVEMVAVRSEPAPRVEVSEPPPPTVVRPAAEPVSAQTTDEAAAYRARPAAQSFSLPPDLVQIETSASSVAPGLAPAAMSEPQQARRPRRAPSEPAVNEPLVQIETRSDGQGS